MTEIPLGEPHSEIYGPDWIGPVVQEKDNEIVIGRNFYISAVRHAARRFGVLKQNTK